MLRDVKVHWNLHKRCWSVHRRGRGLRHMRSLTLVRVRFKVYQAGRKRALEKKSRNVHAFACGDALCPAEPELAKRMRMTQVSYNPFRRPELPATFYAKPSGDAVAGALMLMLMEDGTVWACKPETAE